MGLQREIHATDLARLDIDAAGLLVDGNRDRRWPEKTAGTYDTMAGPVLVMRSTYLQRGGHGGETVCPLEMRLGMVEQRWTPAAAKVASGFMAAAPAKQSARLLSSTGTMQLSPAHLDRLPKGVGRAWEADRERSEASVREAEADRLPALNLVVVILISLDGIMLPMKDAPRTPGAGKQDMGPKGHKEASSGTLALLDGNGDRQHTIYLASMPESKKVTLKAQLKAELLALVERYPDAQLQAVADGAEENWRIIGEMAEELGLHIELVLDFFHAAEHVDEALRRHVGKDKQSAAHDIKFWNTVLRDEHKGALRVREALRYRMNKARGDKKREDIAKQFRCVHGHIDMMNYADLQARNRSIGSGIQAAACKTLVAQRMKRSGMSWREQAVRATPLGCAGDCPAGGVAGSLRSSLLRAACPRGPKRLAATSLATRRGRGVS